MRESESMRQGYNLLKYFKKRTIPFKDDKELLTDFMLYSGMSETESVRIITSWFERGNELPMKESNFANVNHQEYQYLELMRKILEKGKRHDNRTVTATRRLLCETMKFDLQKEFPLLTTKKVYWKGAVHELLWFLSGSTNTQYLKDNNVNFWNANSEDYCERMGKGKDSGDVGRIYGCQWTDWSTRGNKNINQIANAVDQIKNNPSSRRIIVSAWNPSDMQEMALPPCHIMFQFTVDDGLLHCTMYQRSADFFLGIPLNIASYSLLANMVAHVCGLKPGTFCHVMNDVHLYEDHIEQAKEQLTRTPYPFPAIKLNPDVKDIFDFKYEDIELINYKHHPAIKAKMAV